MLGFCRKTGVDRGLCLNLIAIGGCDSARWTSKLSGQTCDFK